MKSAMTYQYLENGQLVTGTLTLNENANLSAHFQG